MLLFGSFATALTGRTISVYRGAGGGGCSFFNGRIFVSFPGGIGRYLTLTLNGNGSNPTLRNRSYVTTGSESTQAIRSPSRNKSYRYLRFVRSSPDFLISSNGRERLPRHPPTARGGDSSRETGRVRKRSSRTCATPTRPLRIVRSCAVASICADREWVERNSSETSSTVTA